MADRRRTAVHWALVASSLWVVPLAALTVALAFVYLLFASFASEALDGQETATTYLMTLGLPSLAFVLATVAGLGAAWTLAGWGSHVLPVARVHPRWLGLAGAVAGALVAAVIFYASLEGASWLGSR